MIMKIESKHFADAMKECKRVGTAHAEGDALRAMYARLIANMHGGDEVLYFRFLKRSPEIHESARALLRDRAQAGEVEVLMNEGAGDDN